MLGLPFEAHRLSVPNQLKSAKHLDAQPKRPRRSDVGRGFQRVAPDQRTHEFRFNALLERKIGEARGELRTTAHEYEVVARALVGQYRRKRRRCACGLARLEVVLDLQQLPSFLEGRAL